MKNETDKLLSNCCHAPIMEHIGVEGTGCWICTKCRKGCDPARETEAAWVKELKEIKANIIYRHKVSPNNFEAYLNDSFINIESLLSSTEKATRERCAEELEKAVRAANRYKALGNAIQLISDWRKEQER